MLVYLVSDLKFVNNGVAKLGEQCMDCNVDEERRSIIPNTVGTCKGQGHHLPKYGQNSKMKSHGRNLTKYGCKKTVLGVMTECYAHCIAVF